MIGEAADVVAILLREVAHQLFLFIGRQVIEKVRTIVGMHLGNDLGQIALRDGAREIGLHVQGKYPNTSARRGSCIAASRRRLSDAGRPPSQVVKS
jgi:hypothetical protein